MEANGLNSARYRMALMTHLCHQFVFRSLDSLRPLPFDADEEN